MNNMDMQKLMAVLSQMNKQDLERGLAKATEILKAKENEENMRKNNCNNNHNH